MKWGIEATRLFPPGDEDEHAAAQAAFEEITYVLEVTLHITGVARLARRAA